MQRFGLALASGLLLFGTAARAQSPAPLGSELLDTLHDGWYFNGETRATAEARTRGAAAGIAFTIDCNGTAPRILLDFRSGLARYGYGISPETTATHSTRVTFTFIKHSLTAVLTSRLDTTQKRVVVANLVTRAAAGQPATSERVVIDGPDAISILTQLKAMDEVSAQVEELGQPISFALTDASAAIDKLLTACASGP